MRDAANLDILFSSAVLRPFLNLSQGSHPPRKRASHGMYELSIAYETVRLLQQEGVPRDFPLATKLNQCIDLVEKLDCCDKCRLKALVWAAEFARLVPELGERAEQLTKLAENQDPCRNQPKEIVDLLTPLCEIRAEVLSRIAPF